MKFTLEIGQIDYAAVAEKLLPLVRDKLQTMDGPMAKMLSGIASLPAPVVRGAINALPESTKNQMVSYLINPQQGQDHLRRPEFRGKAGHRSHHRRHYRGGMSGARAERGRYI